jgi:hypothetical protein
LLFILLDFSLTPVSGIFQFLGFVSFFFFIPFILKSNSWGSFFAISSAFTTFFILYLLFLSNSTLSKTSIDAADAVASFSLVSVSFGFFFSYFFSYLLSLFFFLLLLDSFFLLFGYESATSLNKVSASLAKIDYAV